MWISPRYINEISTCSTNLLEIFEQSNSQEIGLLRDTTINNSLRELLMEINDLSQLNHYGSDIEAEILIKQLLLSVNRFLLPKPNTQNVDYSNQPSLYSSEVTNAIDYINMNLSKELTLDILAKQTFLNKYYLARLFKEETSSTIYQYIIKKRLLLSKKLIDNKIPIIKVYLLAGFNDYSNFFKSFKNEFGITPKQYYLRTCKF